MKLIVSIAFLAACICGPPAASGSDSTPGRVIYYQMENGRFYSCAPLYTGDSKIVIAVGQRMPQRTDKKGGGKGDGSGGHKGKKSKRQGYVSLLELKNNTLEEINGDTFQLTHQDRQWPTRIRTVAVDGASKTKKASVYITGRGGADEEGIGFLRHYIWQNSRLTHTRTFIIEQKQEGAGYTHGYSLKTGDIDGDGIKEGIYGGFYGKTINEHLSEDFADVRIYKKTSDGSIEEMKIKPFRSLKIPLRVNAMEVKDLNGDGKVEIIIAGRSRQGEREYSSFAIWWGDRVTYHVNRDQSLPGRLRTVMALDIDNDGKDELITGGRVDMGERMVADLQCWEITAHGVTMISRYNWSSDASTRLRALAPDSTKDRFIAAGRTELTRTGDTARWIGFVRQFQFQKGSLWPTDIPLLLDKGPETRIRDIRPMGSQYLAAGFIVKSKKRSAGFVWLF